LPPPNSPRSRAHEAFYTGPGAGPPHTSDAATQGYGADPYVDAAADPRTGPPPDARTDRRALPEHDFDPELRADERSTRGRRRQQSTSGAVVPAGSVTSRSLTLVIIIMSFLACLTAGGVYMVNQSASAWLRDVASEVTVQVEPRDRVDTERTLRDAAAFIGRQPGVKAVRPLSLEESSALIEPWIGKSDALRALPVPRLIAIEVDRSSPPDMKALGDIIASEFKGAKLDDHRYWQQQIRTVTDSLALGGLAILMLVGAATTAIIVSATRSSMASNREIVEVLHLVGATDRYIAREFERHFLRLGIRAGLVGAGFATLVFLGLPTAMEMLGGGAVTMAEVRRLFGAGVLDLPGYGVLVVVVIVIAALCMLTSRFGVYHILDQQQR
jgi:cell division transport system permease protein